MTDYFKMYLPLTYKSLVLFCSKVPDLSGIPLSTVQRYVPLSSYVAESNVSLDSLLPTRVPGISRINAPFQ